MNVRLRRSGAILWLMLAASLVGCANQVTTVSLCQAIRPVMTVREAPDGGLWLTADGTADLLIYIEQLEYCAGVAYGG